MSLTVKQLERILERFDFFMVRFLHQPPCVVIIPVSITILRRSRLLGMWKQFGIKRQPDIFAYRLHVARQALKTADEIDHDSIVNCIKIPIAGGLRNNMFRIGTLRIVHTLKEFPKAHVLLMRFSCTPLVFRHGAIPWVSNKTEFEVGFPFMRKAALDVVCRGVIRMIIKKALVFFVLHFGHQR